MAFTPEDGTGLATANAYIALAAFKAHHDDRGRSYTAYTDPQIQGAIVKATDYIDKRFGPLFRGWKSKSTQALAWPRSVAFDDNEYLLDGIPPALARATAELAYIALGLGAELAPPETPGITELSEKVGPIETTTKYGGSGTTGLTDYPEAEQWLKELLTTTTSRELYRG